MLIAVKCRLVFCIMSNCIGDPNKSGKLLSHVLPGIQHSMHTKRKKSTVQGRQGGWTRQHLRLTCHRLSSSGTIPPSRRRPVMWHYVREGRRYSKTLMYWYFIRLCSAQLQQCFLRKHDGPRLSPTQAPWIQALNFSGESSRKFGPDQNIDGQVNNFLNHRLSWLTAEQPPKNPRYPFSLFPLVLLLAVS